MNFCWFFWHSRAGADQGSLLHKTSALQPCLPSKILHSCKDQPAQNWHRDTLGSQQRQNLHWYFQWIFQTTLLNFEYSGCSLLSTSRVKLQSSEYPVERCLKKVIKKSKPIYAIQQPKNVAFLGRSLFTEGFCKDSPTIKNHIHGGNSSFLISSYFTCSERDVKCLAFILLNYEPDSAWVNWAKDLLPLYTKRGKIGCVLIFTSLVFFSCSKYSYELIKNLPAFNHIFRVWWIPLKWLKERSYFSLCRSNYFARHSIILSWQKSYLQFDEISVLL